jgi:hypothetical protein
VLGRSSQCGNALLPRWQVILGAQQGYAGSIVNEASRLVGTRVA